MSDNLKRLEIHIDGKLDAFYAMSESSLDELYNLAEKLSDRDVEASEE